MMCIAFLNFVKKLKPHVMKRFLLFAAVLLLTIPGNVVRAGIDDPLEIIIGDGGSMEGGPTHHAPALIPISCYYLPALSSILVNYQFDLGSVSIVSENHTTGEFSQTLHNSLVGPMAFHIPGTAGHWTITFTLSSGTVYYGEFDIF